MEVVLQEATCCIFPLQGLPYHHKSACSLFKDRQPPQVVPLHPQGQLSGALQGGKTTQHQYHHGQSHAVLAWKLCLQWLWLSTDIDNELSGCPYASNIGDSWEGSPVFGLAQPQQLHDHSTHGTWMLGLPGPAPAISAHI